MIPKWLLQPPASSTYIKMFKGKKKGCRKRKEKEKKGWRKLFKEAPSKLFLSLVDQNYTACPSMDLTTYKGDWDYSHQLRLFSVYLVGLFTFLLKQNQGSISNKDSRMAKGRIMWLHQPYDLGFVSLPM